MAKVLTGILMFLWPILGVTAGSDYFYNSVMPAAEDRATEKPLATPSACADPSGNTANLAYRTIAFEVNGASFCGGNQTLLANSDWYWIYTINPGNRVKIRYATRNTQDSLYTCSTSYSMFLWLKAPGMGVNERYLNSGGGWNLIPTYFRNSPPTDVWNDLYDAVPPAGNYTLVMGCGAAVNTSYAQGTITFKVLGTP